MAGAGGEVAQDAHQSFAVGDRAQVAGSRTRPGVQLLAPLRGRRGPAPSTRSTYRFGLDQLSRCPFEQDVGSNRRHTYGRATVHVKCLFARCDIDPEAVQRADSDCASLHFRVEQFATRGDGRSISLGPGPAWSTSVSGIGDEEEEVWTYLSAVSIESNVRNVILPDDAEATGDVHAWVRLVDRLTSLSVETTAEELESMAYEVILSERLRAHLSR